MDSSCRSEPQQFKSITVLRHPVFLGSKPKENGVFGAPAGSPNAICERRWGARFWRVTHEVLGEWSANRKLEFSRVTSGCAATRPRSLAALQNCHFRNDA